MNHLWRRVTRPKFLLRAIKPEFTYNAVHTFVNHNKINTTGGLSDLQLNNVFYNTIRNKSKKVQHDSDDEDEEFLSDDSSLTRDSKVVKMNTTSLRTDLILKQALGISRNDHQALSMVGKLTFPFRSGLYPAVDVYRVRTTNDYFFKICSKIEQQFYESKIRVNGKKILKKSASVRIGDEIDIIKMVSPKNPDHLYIYRVEIINITAQEESINITARRFKNLLIENYETDPYKGHKESESETN